MINKLVERVEELLALPAYSAEGLDREEGLFTAAAHLLAHQLICRQAGVREERVEQLVDAVQLARELAAEDQRRPAHPVEDPRLRGAFRAGREAVTSIEALNRALASVGAGVAVPQETAASVTDGNPVLGQLAKEHPDLFGDLLRIRAKVAALSTVLPKGGDK